MANPLLQALWAKPIPNPQYSGQLNSILPGMNIAVKKAEKNPRNFGVLSKEVRNPSHANQILNESITNNFWRWIQAGKPVPFVDFMQMRWAPTPSPNDPEGLNKNWAPNVRYFLEQLYGPEQYQQMKKDKIVLKNNEGASYA